MSLIVVALVVALVLGLVEEAQSNGRSLAGWGVVLIAAVLLAGRLG